MDDLPTLLRPQLLHWESFPYSGLRCLLAHVATAIAAAAISPAHCYKITWELGPKRTKKGNKQAKPGEFSPLSEH